VAKRKSKVPGSDDTIEIEETPSADELINQQADIMEGRVAPPPPADVPKGSTYTAPAGEAPPTTIFGQTSQTYDGEADPAVIIKARNNLRVLEQNPGASAGIPAQLPTITMLEPAEAEVGGSDIELHVIGTAFTADTQIIFNGGQEPTTHYSDTDISTVVKPSLVSEAVIVPVLVRNATGESNPLDFEFFEYEPITRSEDEEDKPKAKKGKKGK
jgi:hypothetical protein